MKAVTCFFNSIVTLTEVTEKMASVPSAFLLLLQFCSNLQPMPPSLTEVTLGERTFVF